MKSILMGSVWSMLLVCGWHLVNQCVSYGNSCNQMIALVNMPGYLRVELAY